MRRHRRERESGFTLIELVLVIAITGIITVPIANFVIAYFKNTTQTQARLSESHDVQIAAAYFSQDVANVGVRPDPTSTSFSQSVWVNSAPAPCDASLGNALLLMKWSDPDPAQPVHSVAYIVESGTLHRVYCASDTSTPADITVVHNLVYPDTGNTNPVTCSPSCSASAPTTISLTLSIQARGASSIWTPRPVLTGQRRDQS